MKLKTITKRFACLLLAVVLTVPAVSVSIPANAAAKGPSLSVKKVTVEGGKTFTIKVKAGKAKIIKTKWSVNPEGYINIMKQKKTSAKFYAYFTPGDFKVIANVKYKLAGKVKTTRLTSKVKIFLKDNAVYKPDESCFEFVMSKEVEPLVTPDRMDMNNPEILIWDEEVEMMAAVFSAKFLRSETKKEVKVDKVVLNTDKKTIDVYVDPTTVDKGWQYLVIPLSFKRADGEDFDVTEPNIFAATVKDIKTPVAASGSATAV